MSFQSQLLMHLGLRLKKIISSKIISENLSPVCYKPRTQSNWPVTARLTALFSERSVPAFCHELRELVTRCREGPRLFPANASWGQSPLSRSKQLQSTLRPMSWKERADAPSRRKGRGARAGALGQGRPLITQVVISRRYHLTIRSTHQNNN